MFEFSPLAKTWILDVDGTLVKHNGYKIDGHDTLLPGVAEFFGSLPSDDKVVLLTARENQLLEKLKKFLEENNIRYDHIITGMPFGERILVNDRKPSGLNMAFAVNKDRDSELSIPFFVNPAI